MDGTVAHRCEVRYPPGMNAFIGNPAPPTDAELASALGPAGKLWNELLAGLAEECQLVDKEWSSYSPKAGWALRLKLKKRNIVYLSPSRGAFLASFALGDKAVEAARHSGLPAPVLQIIEQAKRYAEGTAVRIDVHKAGDLAVVKKLAAIKLAH